MRVNIISRLQDSIFAIFLLFAVLFLWPEWRDLGKIWWNNIGYVHGFLVLAAVLTLLWSRRKNIDNHHLAPSLPWLIALVGFTALVIIGRASDFLTLRLSILPFLLVSWGCALWGQRFFRQAAPAIMLLIFAVPLWDDMSPIFQFLTVASNQIFLQIFHIQANIHQFFIETPRGSFHVEEGCSGVNYLMAGLFIASLYSILYVNRISRAALLIFIGAALAIVGNWIRVLGVIVVGYETHMQSPMVRHHGTWGWVIFLVCAMLPFFWIARRLEGSRIEVNEGKPDESNAVSVKGNWLTMPVITALIVGSLPIFTLIQHYSGSNSGDPILTRLPPGNSEWTGPVRHANFWEPHFVKPNIDEGAIYISNQWKQVELYLIGYRNQSQGRELVYYQNKLYRADHWEQISSRTVNLAGNSMSAPKKVRETILKTPGKTDPIIIWSWYRLGDYQTTSRLWVKLVGALQDLQGSSSGQMISVAMQCSGKKEAPCEAERPYLTRFIKQFVAPNLAKESDNQ